MINFFSKIKTAPQTAGESAPPPSAPPADPGADSAGEILFPENNIAAQEPYEEIPLVDIETLKRTIDISIEPFSLESLLLKMDELNASDLHIEVGSPPTYRIKGDIVFTTLPYITFEHAEQLLYPLAGEQDLEIFERCGNIDFCHEIPGKARYRVNFLKHRLGIGGVFRIIPTRIPTLDELGMPEVTKKTALSKSGIILVTGPTGSGKSTTMAAMIDHINRHRKAHIITIEDPLEFVHESINCLISHREVRRHTKSFASALKAALREDPDVILVGEMRDLETISLALTAAHMGILVMGTLHTNNAAKTIERLVDVFPANQQEQARVQLSQSLRAIIAQQLIKRSDGRGRIAALEILLGELSMANMIRDGKSAQIPSYIIMGQSKGMQYMDHVLGSYVRDGLISKNEALLRVRDVSAFERAISGLSG